MYEPYPYQVACLDAIQAVRNKNITRALIVMASGLGKTVTMAFDAKRWRSEQGGRVLFLCHNNDILYQAKKTFEIVNGQDDTYGFFNGEAKNLHNVDFLFASLQTMEHYKDFFQSSEFDYVIVDESHHAQADTYRSTIVYFQPRFLLGATATPDRLDQLDIREIFGNETYYLPLEEALACQFVTPIDYRLLTDEIQLSKELETEQGPMSIALLNRKIFIPRRDEEIANIVMRHTSEISEARTMIFCPSIKYCEHIAEFIPNSFAIHSEVPSRERAVKLEMFRQGIIRTILTVDAFNEGVDIPQANVVVFLRSTTSRTIFLQQLGRGLRRSEGKDTVTVLDFVANCERIKLVYALWRRIEEATKNRDGSSTEKQIVQPMILNIMSAEFTETIIPLLKLLERIRPEVISDIEKLSVEYSPKNRLPADRAVAGSGELYLWVCATCGYQWRARGARRKRGAGCPACTGRVVTEMNCLAASRPDLAEEYSGKNALPSTKIVPGTQKYLWWKCKDGHEWRATGANRAKGGYGCPSCSGRVATEKDNLLVTHPQLAKEYSPRNLFPADKIKAGTNKKLLWICGKCGYEWEATGNHRVAGTGCPSCSGNMVTQHNNLAVMRPDLAREYSERNSLSSANITLGSDAKVLWVCVLCGNEWAAKVYHRTSGSGCPRCAKPGIKPRAAITLER